MPAKSAFMSCSHRSLLLLVCLIFLPVVGSSSGGHDLEHHLAVLNKVDGVTGAKDFGTEGDRAKQFGVYLSVRTAPGPQGVSRIRVACTADIETKLDAALVARRKVAAALGLAALEAAEQHVRAELHGAGASTAAAPPPTEEELEWLASWLDAQPDPSEITHAQAEAVLLQRREQHAGGAASARLMEMQVLLAKERAAEMRLERAERELVKARARIPELQAQKRARTTEPSESYYWSEWALEKWKEDMLRLYVCRPRLCGMIH